MIEIKNTYEFSCGFSYVLIYVFEINDSLHRGCVKVGKATIKTTTSIDKLQPNCSELNKAARNRIDSYTKTASIQYKLLHTELAIFHNPRHGNKLEYFIDKDVHKVLKNSGIKKAELGENKGNEWFYTNVETVRNAIECVKKNQKVLSGRQIIKNAEKIIFRPEQEEAINSTVKKFKNKGSKMLWNAKMRFGKTLSALEVIRQLGYKKSIIITHRPVVDKAWGEDFLKIFGDTDYIYCSRNGSEDKKNKTSSNLSSCLENSKPFIYFASIQDLRGSSKVGGKFDKNNEVFDTDWDLVVIDEAHEGTKTFLGDNVVKNIIKGETKAIYLSGTPFNIINDFDDSETYTWDYIMEQREKKEWDMRHFGDSNPYEGLPQLNIYIYDLSKVFPSYEDIQDKAFNFREFFRVWTGKLRDDGKPLPTRDSIGRFVHEQDVRQFLRRLCEEGVDSNYPFSEKRFQEYFNHSLWMVPGVKEAKALKELMEESSSPFSLFKIVNVAGEDESEDEKKYASALEKLENSIGEHPEETYTITLSCGRLTTGVSVPAWTAVLMLSGSSSTSASSYLQTIFRVQTPANINGKIKDKCYVFDFAPDRTLQMVAEAGKLGIRPGKRDKESENKMREFLNFCPVIAIQGSEMRTYDVDTMLKQLKRFYASRVAQNGFDDVKLYNDELLKLTDIDLRKFEDLKKIIGETKASDIKRTIEINKSDLGTEELEELEEIAKKGKKKGSELTPEQKEQLAKLRKAREEKGKAISILRSISIRIPLMVYGADKSIDEDITIENFANMIDDISWEEFMPKGITKAVFNDFIQYYDKDIFIEAGNQIRRKVKAADKLSPTERVKKITEVFNTFKNPDKETVLTPWRVVNMHLSETLGGYDFFNESHEDIIDNPRFVDNGLITKDVISKVDSKILEINSKSGLYPLYITYSLYRSRLNKEESEYKVEDLYKFWDEAVMENVFVVCKTPMAKSITKRTLLGYRSGKCNTHAFDDLVNQFKNKPDNVIKKIKSPSYWGIKGINEMKFDAIVGNPPYQEMDGGNGASASPIYNYFVNSAKRMNPKCISMIMPSRWFAGGKGLDDFRASMLNDKKISYIKDFVNAKDCFPTASIGGGVCYFLRNNDHEGDCTITNILNGKESTLTRPLNEFDIFIRYNEAINMIHKIEAHNESKLSDLMLSRNPFGLPSSARGAKDAYDNCLILNSSKGISYINRTDVTENKDYIDKYKVMISKVTAEHAGEPDKNGQLRIISSNKVLEPREVCTDSYLILGKFDTKEEADNLVFYIKTRFARYLLLQAVTSINLSKDKFQFVPVQDFSKKWTDKDLYEKYGLAQEEIDFIESMIKPME